MVPKLTPALLHRHLFPLHPLPPVLAAMLARLQGAITRVRERRVLGRGLVHYAASHWCSSFTEQKRQFISTHTRATNLTVSELQEDRLFPNAFSEGLLNHSWRALRKLTFFGVRTSFILSISHRDAGGVVEVWSASVVCFICEICSCFLLMFHWCFCFVVMFANLDHYCRHVYSNGSLVSRCFPLTGSLMSHDVVH